MKAIDDIVKYNNEQTDDTLDLPDNEISGLQNLILDIDYLLPKVREEKRAAERVQ
jgi:hypothetical protein